MAYEKHTWSCGEDITDALLNHMEEGIANAGGGTAVYEVELDQSTQTITLKASYNDLVASGGGVARVDYSAMQSGAELYVLIKQFANMGTGGGQYQAQIDVMGETYTLSASNADDWMSTNGSVTPTPTPPEPN